MPDGADRTRGRTATLNQLLLAAVVFVLGVLVAVGPFRGEAGLFFLGVVIVVVAAAATLAIPWNRLRYGWVAIIPVIDIIAITLMQVAAPDTVLGLLWIFPTTWLASGFGLQGLTGVIVAVAGIVTVLTALSATEVTYRTFLLPLVLFAVGAISHLNARRLDA